jgi:hypothetical protein
VYKYKHSTFPLATEDNYLLTRKGFGITANLSGETETAKHLTMTVVATPHPA